MTFGFRRSYHFPQNASINRGHFRSYEAYRHVPEHSRLAVSVPRRAAYPSSHHGERRARCSGEQKQESQRTYARFRSATRRGYYRQCAIERSQFPRGLRRVSVTQGVVFLPVSRVSHGEHARNTGRCARRSAMFIAPKSRYSRWVSTRLIRSRECDSRRINCSKLRADNRRIYASVNAPNSRRSEARVPLTRELGRRLEKRYTVGYSCNCMIDATFDTATRRKCNAVRAIEPMFVRRRCSA